MGYLLDTTVLLTIMGAKADIPPALHTIMEDLNTPVYASSASVFEVAVKKAMKRIKIPDDFPDAVRASGFDILSIEADQAWKTLRLPFHHPDPFDRLLITQARDRDLTLLTHNPIFQRYDLRVQMV